MATPTSTHTENKTSDILHPLSTLEWEERPSLPVAMENAQAVYLDGTLHIGGGWTTGIEGNRLYSCSTANDINSWAINLTPTSRFALTTYDSHLLLVGGKENPSGQITNKVYTMIDGEFKELLPPMNEKRESPSAVCIGSVLVVAGGYGESGPLSSVEVYKDGNWSYRHSLPDACHEMKLAVCGDKLVLMGGYNQGTKVYSVSLESLVSGTKQSPWETLPDVPNEYSAAAFFGSRILSIGGQNGIERFEGEAYPNNTSSIHAYSPNSLSWVHVGEIHAPRNRVCAIVLPNEKLIVIGGESRVSHSCNHVCQAFIKVDTSEQANRRLFTALNKHLQTITRLKTENNKLRAENDSLKMSLPVNREPSQMSSEERLKRYYQPSASTPEQPKQEVKTEQETIAVTTVRSLASPTEVIYKVGSLHSQPALPAPGKTEAPFNLPGVEVVGQTSVRVTNSKLSFHWTDYGFKLHIPQGSLPAGVDQCLLHISASTAGQYQFPDNMELVSAVYWVRCEPFCQFQQPLTAELQHCAKITSSTNLTFVRAVCSQKDLPYKFKKLEGHSSFTDRSSYGSLQLDRFSGIAVAGEDVDLLYIASLYYRDKNPRNMEIHFVITRDDEPHITEVKQHFKLEGARKGPFIEVEFEEDQISLDIPMPEGIDVDEWKIRPLVPPVIPQVRVDSFQPGRTVPSRQLKATLPHDCNDPIPERSHLVILQGAKGPYNQMLIEIEPFNPVGNYTQDVSTVLSLSTGQFNDYSSSHSRALIPVTGDYWQRSSHGSSLSVAHPPPLSGVANPETAISLRENRLSLGGSSLSSLYSPYPPPHQHTGYMYATPYGPGSTVYSPHHRKQDIPNTSFTFVNLERELKPVVQWHILGTNLGIPQNALKTVKLDNADIADQKIAFVDLIVRNYQFSWEDICKALEDMNESNLATKIRSKYCNEDTAHSESLSRDQPTNIGDKRKQSTAAIVEEELDVPLKKSRSEQEQ